MERLCEKGKAKKRLAELITQFSRCRRDKNVRIRLSEFEKKQEVSK